MAFEWQQPPSVVFEQGALEYAHAVHRFVRARAEYWTGVIENWMKDNASWTDRTGNARQTLFSDTFEIINSAVVVILGHGVDYGIFLELANAGRYSIIFPAMDEFIPRIWADIQRGLQ